MDDEKELLEDQSDIIQKQIDKIKDEADAEDKLYNLEKARYNLKKAENQKTEKTIVDGQVVYKADTSAISDARDSLNDAERDYKIFNLEKEKDVLEEQIEIIEKQQETLEKENEVLDKQIERIQEKIDSTNEYYEEKIANLQRIQDEWQKALDYEEQATAIALLKEKYGANAIEEILSGNMMYLSDWKQEYVNTLAAIDIALTGHVGSATKSYEELTGVTVNMSEASKLASGDLGELSEQAEQLGIDATNLKDKLGETNDSLGNINTDSAIESFNGIGDSANIAKDSISDIATTASDTANNMSSTQFKIDTTGLEFSGEIQNIQTLQRELGNLVTKVKEYSTAFGTSLDLNGVSVQNLTWHLHQVLAKIQEIQRNMDLMYEKFTFLSMMDLTNTTAVQFNNVVTSVQNLITGLENTVTLISGEEGSLQSSLLLQTESAIENLQLQETELNEPLTESFNNVILKIEEFQTAIENETTVAINSFSEHYNGIMQKVVPAINKEIDRMKEFNKEAGKSIKKTVTITYKTVGSSGGGSVSSKATGENILTSAYSNGNGSIKKDQIALVNELGEEMLVRDGKAELIKGGAQYRQLKKGDLVFNAEQTEELLKHGKVTSGNGRAKKIGSFSNGTNPKIEKLFSNKRSFNMTMMDDYFKNHPVEMGASLISARPLNIENRTTNNIINNNQQITIPTTSSADEVVDKLNRIFTDIRDSAIRRSN